MKLLIVDDQLSAAQGIALKIDWKREGFDEVALAKNAMEARVSIRERIPDVMLCDIEMPVESGLELCSWVIQQKLPTQIIILTCHAEFEYAQESIKLNIADYLVQPTSYDNILNAVRRVVERLRLKNEEEKKLAQYENNLLALRVSLWGRYLRGDETISSHAMFAPIVESEDISYLALFQIVRWTTISGQWQGNLMCTAIKNFLQDIFNLDSDHVIVIYIEPNIYAVVLHPSAALTTLEMGQKFEYVCDIFKMYMPCSIAVYPSGPLGVKELPTQWRELQKQRMQNVTMRSGIFMQSEQKGRGSSDIYARWKQLLQGYDPPKMAKDALAFIEELTAQGIIDNEVLRQLYWMLIRFLSSSDWLGNSMDSMLRDEDASALCRDAMWSVDKLKCFILYIRDLSPDNNLQDHEQRVIRYVKQYVREHIEEDIRVEELAKNVHIGADYLTRMFKKEMNCTVKNYIIQQKMMEARNLLRNTNLPVSVVAAKLGYLNFSHFSASYKRVVGYSPSEERKE